MIIKNKTNELIDVAMATDRNVEQQKQKKY